LSSLKAQSFQNFRLYACVNQPDEWWDDAEHFNICSNNAKTLDLLKDESDIEVIIIDKSTKGSGWKAKKKGVGWARKLLMDQAAEIGDEKDIIITIDADTFYPSNYLDSLIKIFHNNPHITAHSNPYYHPLTANKAEDMAILRYELYMRSYAIHMLLIENPYAFSAIGSAMAATVAQYKRMGGISPKLSGEDFYFIQKMKKAGAISQYNSVKVFPQARFSNRVNFGTGPAMIKGHAGDWSSYPFYQPTLFKQVQDTFNSFPALFDVDVETPMSCFLRKQLKRDDIWLPLRRNYKSKNQFVRACEGLVDGLRILQFLKENHLTNTSGDEIDFHENLQYFASLDMDLYCYLKEIGYSGSALSFDNMKIFRDILTNIEYKLRKLRPIT
jgi:hypothetical protein